MNLQAELADVQRRLRALQKKCSKRRLIQECTQKARRCAPTSRQLLDEEEGQELAAEIEWAYIRAPLEDIVMLETKPQELCSWQDLVAGTREQALANIPTLTPEDVKAYLMSWQAQTEANGDG